VSSGTPPATVLVVDDEREVADVYALRLQGSYETRTAYGGEAALSAVDDGVDVVLLDRRMPGISGGEVLERIRERDLDCRVVMLTAVDPGLDIVEMDFDDYLCKPVEKADLVAAIEQQLRLKRYDDRLSEYLEVASKLALLEGELPARQLENDDRIRALAERAETLEAELDASIAEFEDIESAFEAIARHPG
jgi:DNA-binding response OmpR family regulator